LSSSAFAGYLITEKTMETQQNNTVVGVFSDHQSAQRAVSTLKQMGFQESEIGVASPRTNQTEGVDSADGDTYAGEGALTGAAAGVGIGALWGLGILAGVLPAIGPAIAGGTLAILLSNAAAGAAAIGLTGALIGLGISEDDAKYYESELTAGRTIVTVHAGTRRTEVMQVIRDHGGYDTASRSTASAVGSTATAVRSSVNRTDVDSTRTGAAGNAVQAREEKLRVQKTPVQTGEAVVRKEVHTDHKIIDVPVTREELVIERRRPDGRQVSSGSVSEGQEIRIPISEEQVSVQKETVVVEEVLVGKRQVKDHEHIDETLRKEEIKVETRGDVTVNDKRK